MSEADQPDTAPPWRNPQLRFRLILGAAVVAGLLSVGLLVAYPRIVKWRRVRTMRAIEQYLLNEDYRSAHLLVEQLVRKDPTNFPARRVLAVVYESTAPEQALVEWQNLTKAEPDNPENFRGYAKMALKLGQVGRLPAILAALQKLEPGDVEYHRLAAASALATGDVAALREQVDRLAEIEPQKSLTRFTRAALLLNSPERRDVEEARASMAGFARGDELRIRATLALINDAPRRWPEEKIPGRVYTRLADELRLRGAGPAPSYVRIERGALPPDGLTALVEHMVAQPSPAANDAVLLAQWLLQAGRGRDALYWLDTLDEPLRSALVVRQSMVMCAARLELWPRLEQLVSGGAWGPVPTEAIKQAFVARGLRAAHNDSKAGSQWTSAIRLCEQSLPGLEALQRLAQIWRWPDQQVQVLWVIVRQYPANETSWRLLAQQALAGENSTESWRIYQAWVQAVPSNPVAQAERLLVGLLARPGETGLAAAAEELFHQYPEISACRVARALALWRAGRAAEALALLDAGDINYTREPRFALVRGLVCTTLGRSAESGKMSALLQNARLLPEERILAASVRPPAP